MLCYLAIAIYSIICIQSKYTLKSSFSSLSSSVKFTNALRILWTTTGCPHYDAYIYIYMSTYFPEPSPCSMACILSQEIIFIISMVLVPETGSMSQNSHWLNFKNLREILRLAFPLPPELLSVCLTFKVTIKI